MEILTQTEKAINKFIHFIKVADLRHLTEKLNNINVYNVNNVMFLTNNKHAVDAFINNNKTKTVCIYYKIVFIFNLLIYD